MNKRYQVNAFIVLLTLLVFMFSRSGDARSQVSQPVTDTGQKVCYSNNGKINYPSVGSDYYGQDANYESNPMAYKNNNDGTIIDLVTGLMWSKAVNKTKASLIQAHKIADKMTLGGYSDWRVPNIKELYSLMNFNGNTGFNGNRSTNGISSNAIPFINTDYFDFRFGDMAGGERYIDAQWLSSTKYVSTTMNGSKTLFGVNFADGRIKGYGYSDNRSLRPEKKFYVRYVRGNAYGTNDFKDNKDGTITDLKTGLMWMKEDSGKGMDWDDAIKYAESHVYAGYTDWRLPNAKELQYIVDYTKSPDTTNSAAIDSIFNISPIKNEKGQKDFPYFWTSTTHLDGPQPGKHAAYISFGRAMGKMNGTNMDVHGAGAQRSDPKSGQGNFSRGPQGDWVRIQNYVRLVRGGKVTKIKHAPYIDKTVYPYNVKITDYSKTSPSYSQKPGKTLRAQHPEAGIFQGRMGFILRLDLDGDGKVSRSEFDGPAHHFTKFDKNNNGFISEAEAPKGPPPHGGIKRQ